MHVFEFARFPLFSRRKKTNLPTIRISGQGGAHPKNQLHRISTFLFFFCRRNSVFKNTSQISSLVYEEATESTPAASEVKVFFGWGGVTPAILEVSFWVGLSAAVFF